MTALSSLVRTTTFELPLAAPFRSVAARQGVLIEGPGGWGEFSPFDDYDTEQDARWLASAVAAATGLGVPDPLRGDVPVNAILPTAPPPETAALARRAVTALGCSTIKLKVGRPDDVERVCAVRRVLDEEHPHGHGRIRLDANGAWTVAEAAHALEPLAEEGIEYVEQPCATVHDLRKLRARDLGIPVAVDESIRRDRMLLDVPSYADIAVLKVSPLGGPREILRLVAEIGVPVVLSGALESSIGLAQDIAVAAALPDPLPPCGFGTGPLFAADLVAEPILPLGGVVPVHAVEPDDEALAHAEVRLGQERARDWIERLDRAWDAAVAGELVHPDDLEALGLS